MHWAIAAFIVPVPLFHLWLHAMLPWWKKHLKLKFLLAIITWLGTFTIFPDVEHLSPQLFVPLDIVKAAGILLIIGGFSLAVWSFMTLGPRRFLTLATLHPQPQDEFETGGPFKFLPHPAYSGYIFVALGNLLSSGEAYLLAVLIYLLALLPIVIWFENNELKQRLRS